MSEPVSNAEVEDVLASIRRLVSEEKRPAPHTPAAAPTTDAVKEDVALVLTPALRVSDGSENEDAIDTETPADTAQAEDDGFDATASQAPEPSTETEMDVEDGDADAPFLDAPLEDEDPTSTVVDAYAFASQRERTKSAAVLDASLRVEALTDGTADVQFEEPEDDTPNRAAESAAEEDAKSDTAAEEPQTDPLESDLASPEPPFVARFGHAPEADRPEDDDTAQGMSLQSKIAALEAVIGRRRAQLNMQDRDADAPEAADDHPTPETSPVLQDTAHGPDVDHPPEVYSFVEDDAESEPSHLNGPGFVFKEHLQPEMPDALAEEQSDTAEDRKVINMGFEPAADPTDAVSVTEATQVFSVDEDVLDEEALRDMVAEIVRQELQGALGERITRNVRKLVRREIHRALATQDLD